MNDLDEVFKVDYNRANANESNIVQGINYRFTILSERLIRLEYNESGIFENRPSQLVLYRDAKPVKFEKKEDDKYLEISTKYFRLVYVKNKNFEGTKMNPIANLKVQLLNSDRSWYYKHPEVRNYGAPLTSIEDSDGKLKTKKGLYSIEGFASIDDSDTYLLGEKGELIKRENKGIDIYLFMYNNDFHLCLKDYYMITGYPTLIPRYVLGNWWSKNKDYTSDEIEEIVGEFIDKEIPLSIILLNNDWHLKEYQNKKYKSGFTWNTDKIIQPGNLIKKLHSNGIRLGLTLNPIDGIYPYEERYEEIKSFLQLNEQEIIPFNILDRKFLIAYFKYLIEPLEQVGVDFYDLDINNNKNIDNLWSLAHYHYNYGYKSYKTRPLLLIRNPNYAEHRYPITYSGKTIVSWDTLKMMPKYNALATNMGIGFVAHDIGGFYNGMEDNELYTRFVQFGTFNPILKFGSDTSKFYKREPWKWSYKVYKITKDYLTLRHNLIPYLYSESYKYHKEGIPLVVPVYYNHKELYDDVLYNNEYYFGSAFFVSPILKVKDYLMNRVIHRFFLPTGIWYDFVTGKKFIGNKQYLSFFKDEDYPVYVKAGAIIPMGHNENINDTTPPKNMEIQIFPGVSNVYKLYEDDGVSELYKQGYYLLTNIEYTYVKNNYTVIVRPIEGKSGIVPDTRNYKFNFRNTKYADEVMVYINNEQVNLKKYSKGTSFYVEVENVPTTSQLTVICKGNDIEISAERIFMDDIESIIEDIQIETKMKDQIHDILNNNEPIKKKRIAIRKLEGKGLERKFVRLFLKLLEYLN